MVDVLIIASSSYRCLCSKSFVQGDISNVNLSYIAGLLGGCVITGLALYANSSESYNSYGRQKAPRSQ